MPTRRYFRTLHVGAVAYHPNRIASILRRWLDHPAEYRALRERLRPLRNDVTPEAALRALLGE
jgi:hypothetical protein